MSELRQVFDENMRPVIPIEDDMLHTSVRPICSNPDCPCKQKDKIDKLARLVLDGRITRDDAVDIMTSEVF